MRLLCLLFLLSLPLSAQPEIKSLALKLVVGHEGFWQSTQEPKGNVTSRALFAYALALCEANQNLDRLERLFELAAQLQDRNEGSKSYGNFKWKWDDKAIVDYNAVDFAMRGGSLLWLKHKDKIPLPTRQKLKTLLEFSLEGLMRHKVSESYTNIALMNAGDLILLGEALDKPKVAEEGYKRLERVLLYTHEFGTHEYVSPTYYGPDLDALVMIEAFAKRQRGIEQARALLEFFWTDIALNWYAPAQRLSGAHSRSYDYLYGLGELDVQMQLNDWLEGEPTRLDAIFSAQARWKPSEELKKLNQQYPRLVQQKWGIEEAQWRTSWVQKDVVLSTAGASYGGRMDFPLTVDFPGPRDSVRCYFTSDGRGDPYGKIKIAESATHSKALHLNPTWKAWQQNNKSLAHNSSAIGCVIYQDKDIPPDCQILESHFVMPFDNDGLWISDRKIAFEKDKAASFTVLPGETVFLRKGNACLAVRAYWAQDIKGQPAPVNLIYDGNSFGAIRLTVTHYKGEKLSQVKQPKPSGVYFWIANNDQSLGEAWNDFRQKTVKNASDPGLSFDRFPFLTIPKNVPGVLSLNGEELGRKILQKVEPLKSAINSENLPEVTLPFTGSIYLEAESAQIMPSFENGDDALASGGKFIWLPGEIGGRGSSNSGSLTWKIKSPHNGAFYLWARVQTPTPDDDSVYLRLLEPEKSPSLKTWSLGINSQWKWVRFSEWLYFGKLSQLQLRPREDGARIDRLFLTRDQNATPQ